ncbi:MAG: tetratricopeptide repeat protein [Rhodobacteraceae bacterium]|nr:tetratricopeptide repeat protein [Paracoccaceae bacterium]
MLERDARICALGEHPLQDWLVPVLYQQDPILLPVAALQKETEGQETPLPEEAQEQGDYGFIGRQRAIHALERAVQRQPQGGILIHGMAGIGKTTLAKGFLNWLQQTNALGGELFAGLVWFSFDDIRTSEFVINRLVEGVFGHQAVALPLEQKLPPLIKALRETPLLLVWDNFESAAGIEGTEVTPLLPEGDRRQLKALLSKLRGGKSRILITSRSPESWLTPTEVYRLPLGGLVGEEQWEYCNAVVRDLGLRPRRDDKHYAALMNELDGHPLALRAVLLRLQDKGAEELLAELKQAFTGAEGDESTRRIFAALGLLDRGLPEAYAPILQLIGLHRRFVDIDYLARMETGEEGTGARATLEHCFTALENGGLLHHLGNGIYRMHPVLSGFLAQRHPAGELWQRGFVDFMGRFVEHLGPQELHEQRPHFAVQGASFHQALGLALGLSMDIAVAALTQSLASFAQNNRDFTAATRLYESLAEHSAAVKDQKTLAGAYHQLGMIAQEQRDFASAEAWYKKSLAIKEKQGNEHGAVGTYHQLGIIAEKQRDFASAEAWYKKSLAIKEKQGNEHGAASSYHQLGIIAQEQRDFASAEAWYKKALAVFRKQGNEHGAAMTYHQLGRIAQEQRGFASAEAWYKKSLAIKEKQGNEHGAATTYHQLGIIAEEQRDFASAEAWYKKSLAIKEKQGNEHGAATTYHQLGRIAEEQRDFASAGEWSIKAIALLAKMNDSHSLGIAVRGYVRNLHAADGPTQEELRQRWQEAGLDQLIPLEELEKQLAEQ